MEKKSQYKKGKESKKTVAHPDLSKYGLPNMLFVRLIFVNLYLPTTLKGVGLFEQATPSPLSTGARQPK
ncbi:MAG: hypothetical protein PHI68_01705 [Candidatus Cloacimonetes bacterium]|nr:hypothetical protein [Candidatus Cloacimonadota bacterium]